MGTLRKMGAFLGLVPDDHQRYDHHGGGQDEYGRAGYDGSADTSADRPSYDGPSYDGASYDGASHDGASDDDRAHAGADRSSSYGSSPYIADTDADPRYDDAAPSPAYAGGAEQHEAEGHDQHGDTRFPRGGARRPAFAAAGRSRRPAEADASQPDYRTDGALAVQPQVRIEAAVVEPAGTQKPATVSLTGFADAREVGDFYRNGQAVILDMTDLTDAEARRMVDFAAGLAFAVRGSIDKVATKVFMLHPPADTDR